MRDSTVRGTMAAMVLVLITGACFSEEAVINGTEAPETVRIAMDIYPPFQSPTLEHFGAIRIVIEAFELEGINVICGWFPWDRAMKYGMRGEWDAVSLGSRNPEREKAFYFSEPVILANTVFFHHKEYAFDWKTIDDLKGHRIGVIRGYSYGDDFQNARKNLTIEPVTTSAMNMKKLYAGRIDITPLDRISGVFMLNTSRELKDYADFITYHPTPVQKG